ncbi:cytochrome P450 [Frankia gtarii]|uniref:cytochrome P450 n=1 Tax=Frankia gtarii TaxID=2950102 RepID=UPI0021BEA2AA|nr:cytochrome P450 [Frankia gtarii]
MVVSEAIYWDPFDTDIDANPYETWRRMRDETPVYRNDRYDFWALSRHADVLAAHRDPQTYLSGQGTVLELMGADMSGTGQIIFMDPPQHDKLRVLVSKAFTRGRVAQLEARIRQFCRDLLDPQLGNQRFDYVADFGAQLPSLVISSLLGVSNQDRPRILELINTIFHIEPDVGMINDTSFGAQLALHEYLTGELAERRRSPQDDLLTALTEVELTDDGRTRRLTDKEAADFANLLVSAGTETVARLLGWASVILPAHPDQQAALVADPRLIPAAVEELLRYEAPSPVQGRTTSRPVELHGETIPAGAKVLLLTGAAGRDDRVFDHADQFDIHRRPEQHVSFGFGVHFCLGAALARLEGRIALEETLARFPRWQVDQAEAVRLHTSTVRGYKSVPISF